MRIHTFLLVIPCLFTAAVAALAQPTGPAALNGADDAYFLKAALPLDEPRHLCVDTRGFGDTPKADESLWVHTCKDGMWNLDMRWMWSAAGTELIMPQYELCLTAPDPTANAEVWLGDCGTDAARWVWESAQLRPAADTNLCLTIVEPRSEMTPVGATFPPKYRWRGLHLAACSSDAFERQIWTMAQPIAVDQPILPPAGSLPD